LQSTYYFMWFAGIVLAVYVTIMLLMYLFQDRMVYHPQRELLTSPSVIGLNYEDIYIETEDNVTLHGWYVPADSAQLTVLYLHGNAGNISGRLETLRLLHELGISVYMVDYRGYGRSEGQPSEEGTYLDAQAIWNYLQVERNIPRGHIVVMGRSLGGSIAARLAARENPAAAVIESTFISAAELGSDLYPWLPVHWMLSYEYRTLEYIRQIKAPLFMAHSRDDEVVPFDHGKRLYQEASDPKVFLELSGSHGTGFMENEARYREALRAFLVKYVND